MSELHGVSIIGAGGHAKVVVATLLDRGVTVDGLYDDANEKWGSQILGINIIDSVLSLLDKKDVTAIIAIGDNAVREKIANAQKNFNWVTAVSPHTYIHASSKLDAGTVVFAGAVVQPNVIIGSHCIINTGAIVDHECVIGSFSHIAPGVRLAGNVNIGSGSFIGIGSVVAPGVSIGDNSVIGAGSVVLSDVPSNTIAFGVPAKAR